MKYISLEYFFAKIARNWHIQVVQVVQVPVTVGLAEYQVPV